MFCADKGATFCCLFSLSSTRLALTSSPRPPASPPDAPTALTRHHPAPASHLALVRRSTPSLIQNLPPSDRCCRHGSSEHGWRLVQPAAPVGSLPSPQPPRPWRVSRDRLFATASSAHFLTSAAATGGRTPSQHCIWREKQSCPKRREQTNIFARSVAQCRGTAARAVTGRSWWHLLMSRGRAAAVGLYFNGRLGHAKQRMACSWLQASSWRRFQFLTSPLWPTCSSPLALPALTIPISAAFSLASFCRVRLLSPSVALD